MAGTTGMASRVMSIPNEMQRWKDRRKSVSHVRGVAMGNVQEDEIIARALEFGVDGTGDDVARSQVGHFMVVGHEGVPRVRSQYASFSSHGFADEK